MCDSWEGEPVFRCIVHAYTTAKQQSGLNRPQGIIVLMFGGFIVMVIISGGKIFKKKRPFVDAITLLVTRWFDLSELEDQSCSGY